MLTTPLNVKIMLIIPNSRFEIIHVYFFGGTTEIAGFFEGVKGAERGRENPVCLV